MRRGRYFKLLAGVLLILLVNVLAGFATNVPTHLSDEDKLVFEQTYAHYKDAKNGVSPEVEFNIIEDLQRAVLKKVPFGPGIPGYSEREPADVLKRDTGLCYDRSRLFDKLFAWAGFETRHVYILYKPSVGERYSLPLWVAFFMPQSESHAVTEVKTSKGWVLVDSNDTWISVNRQGAVVNADQIWRRSADFDKIPDYFSKPFWAIRGLYSRRGHLYRPYLPYPQFNWSDFFHHLI